MVRKLEKITLLNPLSASDDVPLLDIKFQQAFGGATGDSLIMFLADSSPRRLVFAKVDKNGDPDLSKTVILNLPCPPFCGTDNQSQVNVLTTT